MSQPEYVTRWVRAGMKPILKPTTIDVQVGTRTVTKRAGLFTKETVGQEEPVFEKQEAWVPTGAYSDNLIDLEGLAEDIARVCNELFADGYEVIHMSDVIGGRYKAEHRIENVNGGGAGWGYGFGFSLTDGVVLTARLKSTRNHDAEKRAPAAG